MKNLKVHVLLFVMFLSVNSFAQSVKGSGNVIKDENRKIGAFTKIHVASGIDGYVKIGNENKVVLEADDNIINLIKTEVKDGTLKVYVDKNVKKAKKMKAYITAKSIEGLYASSGADLIVESTIKGKKLSCKASSGADLHLSAEVDNFNGSASSGADIEIKSLKAKTTNLKASSGADLDISSGSTQSLNVSASSSGDIDASDFKAETCNANASSGSDIEIHVTKSLNAKASSGADISYEGNPSVEKKTSGGGEVSGE